MKPKNALYDNDPYLEPYKTEIDQRHERMIKMVKSIDSSEGLDFFTQSYKSFGLHLMEDNSIQVKGHHFFCFSFFS